MDPRNATLLFNMLDLPQLPPHANAYPIISTDCKQHRIMFKVNITILDNCDANQLL